MRACRRCRHCRVADWGDWERRSAEREGAGATQDTTPLFLSSSQRSGSRRQSSPAVRQSRRGDGAVNSGSSNLQPRPSSHVQAAHPGPAGRNSCGKLPRVSAHPLGPPQHQLRWVTRRLDVIDELLPPPPHPAISDVASPPGRATHQLASSYRFGIWPGLSGRFLSLQSHGHTCFLARTSGTLYL